jgi:hypothetical protein
MDDAAHIEVEIMEPESQTKPLSKFPTYLRVLDVLATLCRRDQLRCLLSGVGHLLVFFFATLLVRCLLDYALHFSWTARVALLLTDLLIGGWIVWRFFWKPFQRRLTQNGAALRLQAFAPKLQSRMISTVQLVPEVEAGRAPRSLVEQLLMESTKELEYVEWKQAVPMKQANQWFYAAMLLLVAVSGLAISLPSESGILVSRYFLSKQGPILQTQLEVTSGDLKLPKGSDVQLIATTSGEVPKDAVFQLTDTEGVLETFTVTANEDRPGVFELMVENAQSAFDYQVIAGDARSRQYEVVVLEPPTLRELSFHVRPPAYTGLPAYTTPANDFRMIEGAMISVTGQAADDLDSAAVTFYRKEALVGGVDLGESVDLQIKNERELSAEIGGLSTEAGYISIGLIGDNGVESVNNTRYPIQWVLDLAPQIELTTAPSRGSIVAGLNQVVSGHVIEDYAIEQLQFCYEVTSDSEDAVSTPGQSVPVTFNEVDGWFDFSFVAGLTRSENAIEIEANAGSQLTWWLEATDNAVLPDGSHVVVSPKSTLRVISAEEKIAELMSSVQESMSIIEEVSDRQVEAGEMLKDLIQNEGPR